MLVPYFDRRHALVFSSSVFRAWFFKLYLFHFQSEGQKLCSVHLIKSTYCMKSVFLILTIYCFGFMPHQPAFFFEEVSNTVLPLAALRSNSMEVEFADLDSDGDLDAVIAMEFKPNVLLLNDGKGKFEYASLGRLPQKNHDSEDIAIGDFDRDDDLDMVFVAEDDQQHEYYLNDGKAIFKEAPQGFSFSSTCNAIDAADFDKDGDLDLVLGNAGQDFFLTNDGKGRFVDETRTRMPQDGNITQDIQSVDIERDGDLDLLLGNEDGNRLYLNNGKGFFTDATRDRLPLVNAETRKVDIGDVDDDGDLDVFFSNVDFAKNKDNADRLLINNGKGFFVDETAKRYAVRNNMHTGGISFVDLDGDKDLDIIAANLFSGYLQVALNDGNGNFIEVTHEVFASQVAGDAISVDVIDINNDNRKDLYIVMFRGPDKFFLNRKQE